MISKIFSYRWKPFSFPSPQNITFPPPDKWHLNVAPEFKCTAFSALLCLYDRWHLGIMATEAKRAAEAEFQRLFDFIMTS